jgi:hypothetical protein
MISYNNPIEPMEKARRRLVRVVENQFNTPAFTRARRMGNYGACVLLFSPTPETVTKITHSFDTANNKLFDAVVGETIYELDLSFGRLPDLTQDQELTFRPTIAQVLFNRKQHFLLYPTEGEMTADMFETMAVVLESAK